MKNATIFGYILAAIFAAGFLYENIQVRKLKDLLYTNMKTIQSDIQKIEKKAEEPKTSSFMTTNPVPMEKPVPEEETIFTATAEYKLEGRTVETEQLPQSNLAGVVVIGISVDQEGNVVKTTVGATSTIKEKSVLDSARDAAMKTRFSPTDDGAAKTVGNITYTFSQD